MPLVLSEVRDEKEFDTLCPMMYDAWNASHNMQLKHFTGKFESRDAAISYRKARSIQGWKGNSSRTWIQVTDTDAGGRVVGAACWQANPAPGPQLEPTIASWHPDGSVEREFAERFINGLWGFLAKRVTRPHMDLFSVIVDPEYRMRGVGRMLIRWGAEKADELGIETVISSLPFARGAYEKCGFGCIEVIPADVTVPKPSARWRELQADDLSGFLMWRPIGHDYVEEEDKAPWME